MATATATVVNGLSVQGIQDMVEMVTAEPQVAKAAFYATTIWESGFHNEAVIKPFSIWWSGRSRPQTEDPPTRMACPAH